MKITIESTTKIVELRMSENGPLVPARIWAGHTESGVPVHCYVTRIAVDKNRPAADFEQFERDLQEHAEPTAEIRAIPLRMII